MQPMKVVEITLQQAPQDGVLWVGLTSVPQVLQVDVQQDAAVAAAHHQQGEHVECGEVEHVVDGLLPAAAEAPMGGTLGKVGRLHPDRSEDEELEGGR